MRFLTIVFILVGACAGLKAQTSAELRAKYGEPIMRQRRRGHWLVEKFQIRPKITLTVSYARRGRPCELLIDPVPGSTPAEGRSEHAPTGDYMATAEVIALINELAPLELRGKFYGASSSNGGDPELKLHHPGCSGAYLALYKNVTIIAPTWCWGGTFYASIRWRSSHCRGRIWSANKH
jgi:hypothetical protein